MASTVRSADERCCSTAGCRAAALALATGASAGRWARCWRARPATACTAGATASSADGTAGASTASGPGPATPGAATAPAAASGAPAAGGAGGGGLRCRRWCFGRRRTATMPRTRPREPGVAAARRRRTPTIPATLAPGSQGAAPLGASGAPAAIAIPGGAPAAMSGGATAAIAGAGPGAGSGDGVAASGGGVVRTGVTGAPISPAARANSRVVPRLPSRRCRSAGAGTGGRRPADATRSATGGRGRVTGRWTRWRVTATDVSATGPGGGRRRSPAERRLRLRHGSRLGRPARPGDSTGSTRSASRTCDRAGSTSLERVPGRAPLVVRRADGDACPAAPSSARRSTARRTPSGTRSRRAPARSPGPRMLARSSSRPRTGRSRRLGLAGLPAAVTLAGDRPRASSTRGHEPGRAGPGRPP